MNAKRRSNRPRVDLPKQRIPFTAGIDYSVDETTGCHLWLHAKQPFGHGVVGLTPFLNGARRTMLAHRYAFAVARGFLPDDPLDHLCRTPSCVNPDHLEPVTPRQNVLRGSQAKLSWNKVA